MNLPLNQIIQGDCLETLRDIPDESVDMVFADPPFNLRKSYNSYRDNKDEEEYLLWCEQWLNELVRVCKQEGSIFIHNIPRWLIKYCPILDKSAIFKNWIVWNATAGAMGKSLQPAHYGILYYARRDKPKFYEIRSPHKRNRNSNLLYKNYSGKIKKIHPFGPRLTDVWDDIHRIMSSQNRDDHPCYLPVPLLERIILMSTDENDIVLDAFGGTGSSALACKRLGRQFILMEKDEKYVEIARKKLDTEKEAKIGDYFVSFYQGKIFTIRDLDWEKMKDFFIIPDDIETMPVILRDKIRFNTGQSNKGRINNGGEIF
jgi:site-specific DNA-methyltransferase (adenine-specific)